MISKTSTSRGSAAVSFVNSMLTLFLSLFMGAATISAVILGYPIVTLDAIIKIIITFQHSRRVARMGGKDTDDLFDKDRFESSAALEKSIEPRAICGVVGWREDETLYRRCLESVAADNACALTLAGIDGDEKEDEQMVAVFRSVHPNGVVIRLQKRLAEMINQYIPEINGRVTFEDPEAKAMDLAVLFAKEAIQKQVLKPTSTLSGIRAICIVQPHQNKKDILFTMMSFAIALSEITGINYLFSTDSDSIVCDGAVGKLTRMLQSNDNIGGAAGHLKFFSAEINETYMSRMAESHYWYEQEVFKSQGSTFGSTEVQPGPCAAFQISALRKVLVPWFTQCVLGRRMVLNEDGHLTTRLLYAGYLVHYQPDAVVTTDTPSRYSNWVKQQVRWFRSTLLETIWYPLMMHRLSTWHIYNLVKARIIPCVIFYKVAYYGLLGRSAPFGPLFTVKLLDLGCACLLQSSYVITFGSNVTNWSDLLWLLPTIAWYSAMHPGIHVWALLTVLDGSWGTLPRGPTGGVAMKPIPTKNRFAWLQARLSDGTAFQLVWLSLLAMGAARLVIGSSYGGLMVDTAMQYFR